METIKKILVALDFSLYSRQTLKYAVTLAEKLGAEVVMVNVINQRHIESIEWVEKMDPRITVERFIALQKEERNRMMDRLMEETRCEKVKVNRIFRIGIPAHELLEAIKETGAHLVVMGIKGRTNLASALFGSTAEKIFHRSPVPVLSVRGVDQATLVCE